MPTRFSVRYSPGVTRKRLRRWLSRCRPTTGLPGLDTTTPGRIYDAKLYLPVAYNHFVVDLHNSHPEVTLQTVRTALLWLGLQYPDELSDAFGEVTAVHHDPQLAALTAAAGALRRVIAGDDPAKIAEETGLPLTALSVLGANARKLVVDVGRRGPG